MFLDTSGLLAYIDRREDRHADAVTYFNAAPVRVTHSYVLAEFVPLCDVRGIARYRALDFAEYLDVTDFVEVVWVDEALHRAALSLLLARPDKQWSLCDAASFVLMGQRALSDALTTDHHYAQAGLRPLLV